MPAATQMLHLFGTLALLLGLLLCCTTRPGLARMLLAGQSVAVALAAAALALGSLSVLLGLAVLAVLGLAAVALRSQAPATSRQIAWAVIGILALALAWLAVPQGSGAARETVAIGLGTPLLGLVAACRPGWQTAGSLAIANGVALLAIMLGDTSVALAGSLLALAAAAVAAPWPGRTA